MLKLVSVALFCAQALARPSTDWGHEIQIVGGTPAKEGQFPFTVSLRDADTEKHFCGGALVSERYVLTAAHCLQYEEPDNVVIGVGSVNLTLQKFYKVDDVITHPFYDALVHLNDIALIRLSSSVPLGGNVQTVQPFSTNDTLEGKMVTAMGWGYIHENGPASINLLYLNKPIISNDVCQKRLPEKTPISPGNICLGSELNYGMCFGDSGSPLVYKAADGKTFVAGIVSWGIPCAKGYPDIFTRVSHYIKWINENMK